MSHSRAWDENAPNGAATLLSDIDLVFQQLKVDIRERLVDAGLSGFATADPVGFTTLLMLGALPYIIAGSSGLEVRGADKTTPIFDIAADGSVSVKKDLSVAASAMLQLLTVSGLATFNGGITVAAILPATFNGPVNIKDNVNLNGGQANITPHVVVASGAAQTLNFDDGNVHQILLTANCTFTFANPQPGATYLLQLIQDATGSRVVTWPANIRWPNGIAIPLTTAGTKSDIVTMYYDGTNYLANIAGFAYAP